MSVPYLLGLDRHWETVRYRSLQGPPNAYECNFELLGDSFNIPRAQAGLLKRSGFRSRRPLQHIKGNEAFGPTDFTIHAQPSGEQSQNRLLNLCKSLCMRLDLIVSFSTFLYPSAALVFNGAAVFLT